MHLKNQLKIAPVCVLMMLSGACSDNRSGSGEAVRLARVESDYLTLEEARKHIPDFVMTRDCTKILQQYRKQWIQQKLLLEQANALQLADQPQVQDRLRNARNEVLINALREVIMAKVDSNLVVTDREALRYFNNYKDQFLLEERYVRFRHLSTDNIKFARAARQELQSGTPWPKVAHLYSIMPEQKIQHSKKFWPVSLVLTELPVMKHYITTLDSSEISSIRRIRGTYHFVQLTGVQAEGEYAKPDWIMDRLKEWILLEKQRQYYNSYLKNLYLEAKTDNEIELFNVLKTNSKKKSDTVEFNKSNE